MGGMEGVMARNISDGRGDGANYFYFEVFLNIKVVDFWVRDFSIFL